MCISMSIFNDYQTFSMLIYSYINTSRNWKNEKLCGNMSPTGRSVFSLNFKFFQFSRVLIELNISAGKCFIFHYNIVQKI